MQVSLKRDRTRANLSNREYDEIYIYSGLTTREKKLSNFSKFHHTFSASLIQMPQSFHNVEIQIKTSLTELST